MAIKDIQARLDENVEKKCAEEWQNALNQINKIIRPFFEYGRQQNIETKTAQIEDFGKHFKMNSNCEPVLFKEYPVPATYVERKKDEAASNFVKKVNDLEARLEDLYCEVENMQR